ncbi:hypothetical protein E8E14_004587 [Neopestalotiopsis sp. 37M]|nr:hypothetical protein E8E14_004587 [Neopestalotiopsis sp. 37M]
MELTIGGPPWIYVISAIALYLLALASYRLLLHPLAAFPGPKLAAVTRYVEAYYDVVCNGQYTFKIKEMHRKYGPIVRISPYELHINDPEFFQSVYTREGHWNKYDWSVSAFGAPLSTICTIDHETHRHRRAALNPFFSKANVAKRQDILWRLAEKLSSRIDEFAGSQTRQICLGAAISAFTRDVAADKDTNPDAPPTIVDAIRGADLPPAEKALNRVFEEVGTITGGGFETIANTLRMILYHIYGNPEILRRLREELGSVVIASPASKDSLSNLEQLPYLTAILMEGLRLSPGIATRSQRVAPDRGIHYKGFVIPRGTPVGMTTLLMHYDPTVYEKPDKFDPERWMDTNIRRKADKAFAPFSKGTRICLGMYLAWAELYIVVSALVQRFDFTFNTTVMDDVICRSDDFVIGTTGKTGLRTFVTRV